MVECSCCKPQRRRTHHRPFALLPGRPSLARENSSTIHWICACTYWICTYSKPANIRWSQVDSEPHKRLNILSWRNGKAPDRPPPPLPPSKKLAYLFRKQSSLSRELTPLFCPFQRGFSSVSPFLSVNINYSP